MNGFHWIKTSSTFASICLLICAFAFIKQCWSQAVPKGARVRALKDTIGFCYTQEQIQAVVELAEKLEHEQLALLRARFQPRPWVAGICPHDDHLLAGRVYVHLFQNMKAKRYVIFGVAHKAAQWGVQDSLIFDDFDYWRSANGIMKISDLRQEIIELLPKEIFVINNEWQSEEHSVEGILPFIQYYQPEAEIVSILVPYMNWPRIELLSQYLSKALVTIIKKHGWRLGVDIAFICSNDGDHYGDQDWGGRNLAPFGVDEAGYLKATQQDSSLIRNNLTGKLTSEKLQHFCQRVWGENDLRDYKIRWCGRFAIPFGLNTVRKLIEQLDHAPLHGYLLRYDTSYRLGKLPLEIGIGTTAPYNIHHWVGYSAIGYY
ncbi:MAG: AmmeMemoRadiSam system protein B [candidate division KSB1 bacterium]|nr:AmmeMemoRadiSam system protein B [candidate division KSB1 bacterium]